MGNVNYAACDEAGWVETISRTLGDSLPLVNVWKQVTAVSCSQLAPDPMGRQRIIVDFAFEVVLLHTAAARVAMSDLWTLRDEARQSMLLALSGEDVSAYWAVESLHALDRLPMLHNRSFAQLMKMVNIPDSLRAVHNVMSNPGRLVEIDNEAQFNCKCGAPCNCGPCPRIGRR